MNDLSRDYFPDLKRRMAEAGISGNRLAKALGHTGAGAVSRYLNGKQAARAGTIQKFEKAFQALIASGGTLDTTPEEIGPQRGAQEPTEASNPAPQVSEGPWGSVVEDYTAFTGADLKRDWAESERKVAEATRGPSEALLGEAIGRFLVTEQMFPATGPTPYYNPPVVENPALEGADVITPKRHNVWVCGVCGQENLDREARCPRCLTFR